MDREEHRLLVGIAVAIVLGLIILAVAFLITGHGTLWYLPALSSLGIAVLAIVPMLLIVVFVIRFVPLSLLPGKVEHLTVRKPRRSCPNCGFEVRGERYCPNCGWKL